MDQDGKGTKLWKRSSPTTKFANNARKSLLATKKPITWVLGNEAADLDSVACAIIYASHLAIIDETRTVIPVVNVPEDEHKLRKDNLWALRECGIDPSNLVYTDLLDKYNSDTSQVVLVDHNQLSVFQKSLGQKVTRIIDHHQDTKTLTSNMEIRRIEKSGSCTTLVVDEFEKSKSVLQSDPTVSFLTIAAILLDTNHMKDPNKTTELDLKQFKTHSRRIGLTDEKALFDRLLSLRLDVSDLKLIDLMAKDAKFYETSETCKLSPSQIYGVSTILLSFQDMEKLSRSWISDLCGFGVARSLNTFYIMTSFKPPNGQFAREIGVFSRDEKQFDIIIAALNAEESFELEVIHEPTWTTEVSLDVKYRYATFRQHNLAISRKRLVPVLQSFVF